MFKERLKVLKDKSGIILHYLVTVKKSHEKPKTNNMLVRLAIPSDFLSVALSSKMTEDD